MDKDSLTVEHKGIIWRRVNDDGTPYDHEAPSVMDAIYKKAAFMVRPTVDGKTTNVLETFSEMTAQGWLEETSERFSAELERQMKGACDE